ncbi:MAG: hypothetical protein K2W95_10005 [Candidatus Obscuribacterales bacterium]|nr:hypothetical protein [Candidatus Obscuribacterales bacterium]
MTDTDFFAETVHDEEHYEDDISRSAFAASLPTLLESRSSAGILPGRSPQSEIVFTKIQGYDAPPAKSFAGLDAAPPSEKPIPEAKPLPVKPAENAPQSPEQRQEEPKPESKPQDRQNERRREKPEEKLAPPLPVGADTQTALECLEQSATRQITNQTEREQFQRDLTAFRSLVGRGLSETEFRATVRTITELMNAENSEGSQPQERRILGARALMHNLGYQGTLGQIGGTCGAASIERILCQTKPSLVAEMVSSALRFGQWTGADGRTINIPAGNLVPERPQLSVPPARGEGLSSHPCSYASQVFLSTMVNEIGQHLNPPLVYERRGETEEWVSPDGSRVNFVATGSNGVQGERSLTGGLPSAVVVTALRRITGEDSRILLNPNYDIDRVPTAAQPVEGISADGLERVTSLQELQTTLARLRTENRFPLVVSISSSACSDAIYFDPRFPQDRRPDMTNSRRVPDHFVTIHAYTPGTPGTVQLRNSWGTEYNATVPVDFLFRALGTHAPERKP